MCMYTYIHLNSNTQSTTAERKDKNPCALVNSLLLIKQPIAIMSVIIIIIMFMYTIVTIILLLCLFSL